MVARFDRALGGFFEAAAPSPPTPAPAPPPAAAVGIFDPPPPAAEPADWRELGACGGTDLALWFSEDDFSVGTAKLMCAECVSREPCLEFAMSGETGRASRYGVFGGLDPDERYALHRLRQRRERKRQAAA